MTDPSVGVLPVAKIRPAYRQVADQLRELITSGELSVGQRLPPESEIAAAFGVSRGTVREALRVLQSQNLISTSRGVKGGSFVTPPRPAEITAYLETSIGLLNVTDSVTVGNLLEARLLLEPQAARLAAVRRTEAELDAIRQSLAVEREAVARHQFENHRRFHKAVLAAAGNALLAIMTEPVFEVLRMRLAREQAPDRLWERVVDDHARILECIEERDAAGAEEEMRRHLLRLEMPYREIDRRSS